jgi:hypothetical protein
MVLRHPPSKNTSQGHPLDEPTCFAELKQAEQEAILFWVRGVMRAVNRVGKVSSYGFKHFCEDEVGFYVSNGAMKGAMLAAGHKPTKTTDLNPRYRVRPLPTQPKTFSKVTLARTWSGSEVYTILNADPTTQLEFVRLRRALDDSKKGGPGP